VTCVRNEGQRVGEQAIGHLQYDEPCVQRDPDGEGSSEACWRMRMAVMAMLMTVAASVFVPCAHA
jgi:hypothetical protein